MLTPAHACPVCRRVESRLERSGLYDDRYGFPGSFNLWRCSKCDHRFLAADFSDWDLRDLYTQYYPRARFDLAAWRPAPELSRIRLWWGREYSGVFRWVPRGVKVLDVGCGFGESVAYHAARECEAHGIEADENILRVGERFGLSVRAGLFRAADFAADSFDYVTLDQVIEHSSDPLALLKDVERVLKPGGIVLLSTPNASSLMARWFGERWLHWHSPYHLQLFSARSLAVAAAAVGLRVEWSRQITSPRWYAFQWLHLLSRPAPGEPSFFWTNGRWPRRRWFIRKTISGLGRLGMNHVIAQMLDGLSLGDNLVVALRKTRG